VKRALLVTAALGTAVVLLAGLSLPPARHALVAQADGTIAGVMHVHTNRSDGRSSPDDIALAASRAGLAFVVFSDHGDGTRPPDPPTYRSGVLCLDGVEISTTDGHYIAIDMPVAPYPLGGEARDVVEDVRRLGGFGIVAHPDSPKADLRWGDWSLPFDGVEILNLDTAWRQHLQQSGWLPKLRVLGSLLAYPFRSEETIGSLTRLSSDNARAFGTLVKGRRVVATGGVDAHARLGLGNADPFVDEYSLPFPGYETVFRALAIRVRPERALTGDSQTDARLVMEAIRAGRLHSAVVALASPPFFEFTAENRSGTAQEGDRLRPDGPVTLRVRSNAPGGFSTTVFEGTQVLATGPGQDVVVVAPGEPGVYRAEILATDWPGQPTWIVSNPIYVRDGDPVPQPPPSAPVVGGERRLLFDGRDTSAWRVEFSATSRAQLGVEPAGEGGSALRLEYDLAEGPTAGQFSALVVETPGGIAPHTRLQFRVRADRPMRISVRVRVASGSTADDSWSRSVYVDSTDREVTIPFRDMNAVGVTPRGAPPPADVHSILFSVDAMNTKPGSSGRLSVSHVELQR
jgi:hypothetical protein